MTNLFKKSTSLVKKVFEKLLSRLTPKHIPIAVKLSIVITLL